MDPDILILQEVWHTPAHGNMAERLAADLEMNYVYARANGSRRLIGFEEGSAVLSRFPITRASRLVLSPRQPWWETRIALVAAIDLGSEEMTVVGAHLAYQDQKCTERQTMDLIARIPRAELLVLAGDFNAESDSASVRRVVAAGYSDTVPGGIDHLFLPSRMGLAGWKLERAAWTLREAELSRLIGKQTAVSDHPGIVADLVRVGGP